MVSDSVMNVQKKIITSKTIPSNLAFTKCTRIEKKNKFQPILKSFTATCNICKKGFVASCTERDPLISHSCLPSKVKPSVCNDCHKTIVRTTGHGISSLSALNGQQLGSESNVSITVEAGRSIDEQLTNTHISKESNSFEKDDEWVIVKVGKNSNKVETEKVFSIKLCDEECNEESMVVQSGGEEIGTISSVIVSEIDPEEDMVTQGSDSSVKDIIQIGSLSFGSSCSDSDSLSCISQASDVASTSKSLDEVDHAWSVCTNKFTTGVGKFGDWTVCTKGFSIRGDSSYVCKFCQKYFKSESDLKFHMLNHTSVKSLTSTVQSLKGLKEKKSSDPSNEGSTVRELHTCSICSKSFSDVGSLKMHFKIHSISLSDSASNAFKKVSSKGLLNRNPFIQVSEKIMACTICGARFQHKQQLTKHTKAHLILTCKVCQRVFKSSAKLKKHMLLMCGDASTSDATARERIGSEIPSTSASTKINVVNLKDGNNLDEYEKSEDICIKGGSEKIKEENEVKNYLVVDDQNSLSSEPFIIVSEEKECDISPLNSILVENLKEEIDIEEIDIEDFPMVEEYSVMNSKNELHDMNSSNVKKKNRTAWKSKCS